MLNNEGTLLENYKNVNKQKLKKKKKKKSNWKDRKHINVLKSHFREGYVVFQQAEYLGREKRTSKYTVGTFSMNRIPNK